MTSTTVRTTDHYAAALIETFGSPRPIRLPREPRKYLQAGCILMLLVGSLALGDVTVAQALQSVSAISL